MARCWSSLTIFLTEPCFEHRHFVRFVGRYICEKHENLYNFSLCKPPQCVSTWYFFSIGGLYYKNNIKLTDIHNSFNSFLHLDSVTHFCFRSLGKVRNSYCRETSNRSMVARHGPCDGCFQTQKKRHPRFLLYRHQTNVRLLRHITIIDIFQVMRL